MFKLFRQSPASLLTEQTTQWMFETYGWALDQFDASLFYQHTELVLPSNRYFPGRANNPQEMAQLIFDRVAHYAAVSHWPASVVDQQVCQVDHSAPLNLVEPVRAVDVPALAESAANAQIKPLLFPYQAEQVSNPEAMIANFAHGVAHYLGQTAITPPPGGPELWPQTTEVLATFLGFGLMFANSAYNFRGGCGSCYNPAAQRQASLTEQQATYALALFAVLKNLPVKAVSQHLKGHLRGFYKKAVKEIRSKSNDLGVLPIADVSGQALESS